MPAISQAFAPRTEEVLTRAVVRAAENLGVRQKTLARVLGISAASVSRLDRSRAVDPESKEGELAVLFLRVYRSLDALVGGDEAQARAWLWANNHHLGGVPGELLETVTGLAHVTEYLDAMRGRL